MRQPARILFGLAALLSLVTFVGGIIIWAMPGTFYFGRGPQFAVGSDGGVLEVDVDGRSLARIPLLVPIVAAFFPPLYWLRDRLERREARREARTETLTPGAPTCPTCGYDLRATPDRCPECGAVPAGRG